MSIWYNKQYIKILFVYTNFGWKINRLIYKLVKTLAMQTVFSNNKMLQDIQLLLNI